MRWLRLMALLSVVVPLVIYAIFGVVGFLRATDETDARVSRSLRVAHEHASKVMATSEAVMEKAYSLVNGKNPQALHSIEAFLHEELRKRTVDQPQIQSILVLDAQGRPIASSRLFPFPGVDLSDGEYFQHHLQGRPGAHLSKPLVTRTSNERVLNVSVAFEDDAGKFGGVINVALLTSYFYDFYGDLVADEPNLAVSLFRGDGEVYTRWPHNANTPDRLQPNAPVMQRLRAGEDSGRLQGFSPIDQKERVIAYRKVGDYPLYVSTAMRLNVPLHELFQQLALLFAMGALPVAALVITARTALHSARAAHDTLQELEKETESRQRAEEALRQAQKLEALGRLTGGVAHDFNNALMVISNNLHLLKRTVPQAGMRQIDSIARAVKSATNLTRQLLAFSRRQPLVAEYVQLQHKLPAIQDLIVPVLGSRVRLEVQVDPSTAPVFLDLSELELALLNLSINARDAMPTGGALSIQVRNAGPRRVATTGQEIEMVVIEVSDTGSGIAQDDLDKVFEPFFTTKPVGEGTGLGLSQVYGFCQGVGGYAEIASEVGKGTKVSLYLPSTAPRAPRDEPASDTSFTPLGMSLLLVEDNDEVAESLVPLLQSLGCSVTRVDRADKAIYLLDEGQRPDLVLSDVMMPGELNGEGLARHIREKWPAQRVLLMTGYAEQLARISQLGFDVLPKPCTPQMLHAAIGKSAT
ncbi:hybrid sensor histidine kinase/response regulator [Acidovorax sp. CF316]|uniref:hybrid sensor histidine kinase/response regulator n=1 Tax=Acidovorax sp. CF316 TaxID=1144317 RepID=UPI001EE65383|nr:hybrid sensor histidine kinase/response regulator [Acidovorax sp. CF316]